MREALPTFPQVVSAGPRYLIFLDDAAVQMGQYGPGTFSSTLSAFCDVCTTIALAFSIRLLFPSFVSCHSHRRHPLFGRERSDRERERVCVCVYRELDRYLQEDLPTYLITSHRIIVLIASSPLFSLTRLLHPLPNISSLLLSQLSLTSLSLPTLTPLRLLRLLIARSQKLTRHYPDNCKRGERNSRR
ncbi:hypothetical protein LX36DRAFT_326089 [Colletotrichum falcatum]|nr:hypothetical protein LX36DRAFT_326089 [Colletotrichum falcatum]